MWGGWHVHINSSCSQRLVNWDKEIQSDSTRKPSIAWLNCACKRSSRTLIFRIGALLFFSVVLCACLSSSLNPVPASSSCVMTSALLATPAATPCTPRRLSLRPSESSTNLRHGSRHMTVFAPSTHFIVVIEWDNQLDVLHIFVFQIMQGVFWKGEGKLGRGWAKRTVCHFSVCHRWPLTDDG